MEESMEYDEGYCFKCCTEYYTSEPCPECDCSFLDYDDELWGWGEEEEEV